MRITGGEWRGRALLVPVGTRVRPTSDRARAALFNVLMHRFQGRDGFGLAGGRVLDAFAGSGALGLEALSRGAAHVTFFDTAPPSLRAVEANLKAMGGQERASVIRADAVRPPPPAQPVGLAFLDPPYAEGLADRALSQLLRAGWLAPGALVCVETDGATPAPAWPGGVGVVDERTQGRPRLTILRVAG
ncbi:16S rRNA (guanine(966)-N(2))-methyltransferase RsmD [Pararhodospirillum oryzae]|uniref:DNA methyltransferase n=1 Tax=Pararhodospirillum oryzae TaxID=478448 RepID=A0A512HBI5_9PROT|nr:16S rRNA (guanine(966)-N(2))-methyltransferase RsmD [Pararhodospirillum oryzae]GEO82816.1 DNA methyltransferase [Pararhodospirillum oryzae]